MKHKTFATPFGSAPLSRAPSRVTVRREQRDLEGPGLLVSPAFWIGAVFSLGVWALIGYAVF